MKNLKINMTFDILTWRQPIISNIITKCIETTLAAENINVPCEINVMVTNDKGIHAINLASRQIDRPTDVLSFPMFELEPGNPPEDWDDYLDFETDMCPLGDMCISLERAMLQFSYLAKRTERIGEKTFRMTLNYRQEPALLFLPVSLSNCRSDLKHRSVPAAVSPSNTILC